MIDADKGIYRVYVDHSVRLEGKMDTWMGLAFRCESQDAVARMNTSLLPHAEYGQCNSKIDNREIDNSEIYSRDIHKSEIDNKKYLCQG